MIKPLISVVLTLHDYAGNASKAARSVFAQTHRPLELIVVAGGAQGGHPPELDDLIANPPREIEARVISHNHAGAASAINAGLAAARGDYFAVITPNDEYAPERLERCLAAAQAGGVVVTHLTPMGRADKPLGITDPWRGAYDQRLLHHIAVFPNLSCLSVCMDVVVTPGNLFMSREIWSAVGEFADFPRLYYLDFFLRAALQREPALIREKLLTHRVQKVSTIDEHADVIRKHILTLWSGKRPANPLADVFTAHAFLFSHLAWPKELSKAFDDLLEYREAPAEAAPRALPHKLSRSGRQALHVTLVTHELSLTGAPVIVLEMASLLRDRGCRVKVLSLIDGPLKAEFKRRAIPLVTPPLLFNRISRLHEQTLHWALRGKRLPERILHELTGLFRIGSERAWQLQLWLHAKGVLVLNSIASWPLVTQLPATWRKPAYWYIHESLDPHWLIPGERANSRLQRMVAVGRLKMIYGSDATRQHWAGNNYDGTVRYWSGVSRTVDYLGPASDRARGQKRKRRVILNIGSISGRKGTRTLVEAFALGRAEGFIPADVELCIVGCPRPSVSMEARDLIRRIYQPDLRGYVRVVHNVQPATLTSYYREADVYAHASIFDCMPIALLTAMAHGLPIVTTDVDGCKEAIQHDTSGLVVPHGQPRVMAEALGILLAEPDRARALGKAGRARFIEHFSIEATFEPLYDTLVEHASSG